MTRIDQSALLPYSADKLFALVNDIASYPEFMDGCLGTEILESNANEITASLTLGKSGLQYSLTTRNSLDPPVAMVMTLVDGPFKQFDASWHFKPLNDSACKVSLKMEFEFASGLVDIALKQLFDSTSRNLVNSVCKRADLLYGPADD